MVKAAPTARDTSIATYRAKRDFARTAEPAPGPATAGQTLLFVVQKHAATRLHWDFRLEHGGVLWSWAVPRGPSMDPHDKRLAVHVEDHPVEYARFEGDIAEGNYGAGHVDIWDRGHWRPVGEDAAADLARGEIKFILDGDRLQGRFVLIRLKPRPREHAENWLLIKEHDEHEAPGRDVAAMEQTPLSKPAGKNAKRARPPAAAAAAIEAAEPAAMAKPATRRAMPADAVIRKLGATPKPQLASATDIAPEGGEWISEIKFDGYRLLARRERGAVQLITRNGLDWTTRLPAVAAAVAALGHGDLLLDGELVALQPDGVSSFHALQTALRDKRDDTLFLYAFDLLHLDAHDLAPCPLAERKAVLAGLTDWAAAGMLRYSDHVAGNAVQVRKQACTMGLEGVICKRADAPYRPGRGRDWLKVKCQGREEFVVLGWTKPQGSRSGLGSLHLGFFDPERRLHYVGGCGSGFSDADLGVLADKLKALAAPAPKGLLLTEEKPPTGLNWVRPGLVVEVQYIGWSGAGRLRHAVFLGLREDKPAAEVVRDVPDPEAKRITLDERRPTRIVTAKPPAQRGGATEIDGVRLTHPERELWPGITKQDLATYWQTVATVALPGIADRPLALVRCPDGIDSEHFFQKHALRGMAAQLREGDQDGAPYLALTGQDGLIAATQMSAIELHGWGSHLPDAGRADRLVFDLDPGEGVDWPQIIRATLDVRDRLEREGFASFCRTSGGKGLHVVAPLRPDAGWDQVRAWCRRFAEQMEAEQPSLYVASVPKAKRTGRILIDWLRNGLGSTAVCSFSPRARPGAGVATPLHWREVGPKLDVTAWTLKTVPGRLAKLRADPWPGFDEADQRLPVEMPTPRKRK